MERWHKWGENNDAPRMLYLKSIANEKDALRISFTDDECSKRVWAVFGGRVWSYRNTDEGGLLKTLGFLTSHYGKAFYAKWALFEVEESGYIKWFLRESCGVFDYEDVRHFVFMTPNDVVEVLTDTEPIIEVQDIKEGE